MDVFYPELLLCAEHGSKNLSKRRCGRQLSAVHTKCHRPKDLREVRLDVAYAIRSSLLVACVKKRGHRQWITLPREQTGVSFQFVLLGKLTFIRIGLSSDSVVCRYSVCNTCNLLCTLHSDDTMICSELLYCGVLW